MKKIYSSVLLFFLVVSVTAQTPSYWNFNVAAGNNSFPFNTTTSRKVQWRINANSLNGPTGPVTQGNNITVVYFQTGSNANATYPLLNISLKQGPAQFSAGGLYETGMTQVFTGTNVNKITTTGGWMSFTLTTPFLYDPSLPLFVEAEHNATSGGGPTVYQSSPAGPGFGRLYGNYPNANYNGADQTVVHFGVDVVPATPCTGAPPMNTVVPQSFSTCPGLSNPNLGFAATFSLGGLTYQWQSSTVSPVGPYSAIPGATMHFAPTPTIGVTTWYQAVVTCTNAGGGTTTLTPTQYYVMGNVSGTVPYYEDFEGLQMNDRLPNCSWFSPTLGSSVKSYTTPESGNRVPRSGNKFASFTAPANNAHVYTHPIYMEAGITYSAGIWFATEYFGGTNWNNLALLVGPNQSPTGLNLIASTSPAISGPHKDLGGVFTVPSSGFYHIAVRATGGSGAAPYLSWDDLEVTIPCSGPGSVNSPTVSVSVNSQTVCANDVISISATGADTYSWSTGATQQSINDAPVMTTTYTVWGTNTLTGCMDAESVVINVNPAPSVFAFASSNSVCAGSPVQLTAVGALSYVWSNGGTGANITANPAGPQTTYTVIGTNQFGCTGTDFKTISVSSLPNVVASSNNPAACKDDELVLNATGGQTYLWYNSATGVIYQGSTITLKLKTSATFTVVGKNAQGCSKSSTVFQDISECVGLKDLSGIGSVNLYPNPTNGIITVEFSNSDLRVLELSDLSGRVIVSQQAENQSSELNISNLSAGVYYLTVKANGSSQVLRVVKQ